NEARCIFRDCDAVSSRIGPVRVKEAERTKLATKDSSRTMAMKHAGASQLSARLSVSVFSSLVAPLESFLRSARNTVSVAARTVPAPAAYHLGASSTISGP